MYLKKTSARKDEATKGFLLEMVTQVPKYEKDWEQLT